MPKVSVIINCYNGEEYLEETLESLKAQTYTDYELVFWDNCSTDRSPEIAKTFDERLRYFRGETLIPLGEARNMALQQTRGEYVAFLDSDDLWEPNKLAKQVAILEENADCGMVFTNFYRLNMLNGVTDVYPGPAESKMLDFSEFMCKHIYCLSAFLIRKEALSGLDHWFNNLFQYAEEFELFIRVAYNWKPYYFADPLVTYRIHNKMTTLKVRSCVADEFSMALENLKKEAPSLEQEYPEVVRLISYNRDFAEAKYILPLGENRRVRELMKPYWDYNIRAKCYYLVACMPAPISRIIYKLFYRNRI